MKYSKHSTYYNKEEVEVPSVTTVLKILNKPFLSKWANIMGFKRKNIDDILEKSSMIGTLVHALIEAYIMKKSFTYMPSKHYSKTLAMNYMKTFMKWKEKHELEPEFMEKKFSCDKFGGTVDYYGLVDKKKTIQDFKTSKQFYPSMFLQLGAYCYMLELEGYEVEQVGIIIINENKSAEKYISREELQKYINVFLLLVDVFHVWYALNIDDEWGDICADK